MEFTYEDLTADEYHHRVAVYQPLTAALRELVDAVIRTEVDDATARSATETISEVTATLRAQQIPGAYGVRQTAEGRGMAWGNAVIGLRNAIAPPLKVVRGSVTDRVVAHADVELGAAYEGPSGHVHGGVVALLFDQVLGEGASMTGLPSYTGTLTIRYLRPTPLGPLRIEAFTPEQDGRKTLARAAMLVDGTVTAEAEGLFISPRQMTSPSLHPFAGESR